jgi:hypothetical protein
VGGEDHHPTGASARRASANTHVQIAHVLKHLKRHDAIKDRQVVGPPLLATHMILSL